MIYLLDTNICIYLMSSKAGFSDIVHKHFQAFNSKDIRISVITTAELYYGAAKSNAPDKSMQKIALFLTPFDILPFEQEDSLAFGNIKGRLAKNGTPIGLLDNMIAAQAITRGYTVVTNNVREFAHVPDLKIENWASE